MSHTSSETSIQTVGICGAGSYAVEVAALQDVQDATEQLDACLRGSEVKASGFSSAFHKFSTLWKSDLPAALQVGVVLRHKM